MNHHPWRDIFFLPICKHKRLVNLAAKHSISTPVKKNHFRSRTTAGDAEAHFFAQKISNDSNMATSKPCAPKRCEAWLPNRFFWGVHCFLGWRMLITHYLMHFPKLDALFFQYHKPVIWLCFRKMVWKCMKHRACNSGEVRGWRFGSWMGCGDAAMEENHNSLGEQFFGEYFKQFGSKYRYFVWAHHSEKFQNISLHYFYFYFLIFHVLFLFFWTLCFLSEFLRNVLECFVFFSECFGFVRFFGGEFVGISFRGIFKNFAAV